jgi:RNA polymerase sigma factor (sigma-70 family)
MDPDLNPPDIHRARFEAAFEEHYAAVLAFTRRRIPGPDGAQDMAAETFATAWRRRDSIPDPARPWLFGIALRVLANQRRSDQRRHALDRRLAEELTTRPTPGLEDSVIRNRDFASAFAELTETEQEVLRLIAWDGLTTREGAQVLGCSSAAFRVRLHRARRKLATELGLNRAPTPKPRPALDCPTEEIS